MIDKLIPYFASSAMASGAQFNPADRSAIPKKEECPNCGTIHETFTKMSCSAECFKALREKQRNE